jgi:hypothetical protein
MGASDVTLAALKPNILSNLTRDAMERSPIDKTNDVDWDLPCLLTVAIPSARLWLVSTSPKRLLLVTKFIIAKFPWTAWLDDCKGKQACRKEVWEREERVQGVEPWGYFMWPQ